MPPGDLVLAIDQGTSSTKAMTVDREGRVVGQAAVVLGQSHQHPGWVEQDPAELWSSVQRAVRDCVPGDRARNIAGVALSVQRESVLIWDRRTSEPVSPVLSWQDQRTAAAADLLDAGGHASKVFATTGLPLDPMFSALKAKWLLDEFDPARARTRSGEWCVGTLDTFLLSRMSAPAQAEPVTEIGCASRTQLLDIDSGTWDAGLLDLFGVPEAALPRVVASTGPFMSVRGLDPVHDGTPVLAVMADSHAALFAHRGWRPGIVKCTYGTGSSVMAVGPRATETSGVCSTIAWQVEGVVHALEANIRSTGRTMSWLADLFGVDPDVLWQEASVAAADGVHIVPAFGGLGAPYWDRDAVAVMSGLSLGSQRPQLARAAMESIAHQVDDVLRAFTEVIGPLQRLACDGGMTRSAALMQAQADLSGVPVHVSPTANLSGMGVAHLAGVVEGWWTLADLEAGLGDTDEAPVVHLAPRIDPKQRAARRAHWGAAVERARSVRSDEWEVQP